MSIKSHLLGDMRLELLFLNVVLNLGSAKLKQGLLYFFYFLTCTECHLSEHNVAYTIVTTLTIGSGSRNRNQWNISVFYLTFFFNGNGFILFKHIHNFCSE